MRPKRSHGMGTLVLKPNGQWMARWMVRGRIHTKMTGEKDRRKALVVLERLTRPFREKSELEMYQNLVRELEKRLNIITPETAPGPENLPIDELWDTWLSRKRKGNISPRSAKLYRSYVRKIESWCAGNGVKSALELTKDRTRALVDTMDNLGATGFNLRLSFFQKMWNDLSDGYGLDPKVWDLERMKERKVSKRKVFEVDEIARIWGEVSGDVDMRVLVAVGLYTGLRIGDAANLTWDSVDFSSKVVRLVAEKDGDYLELPLHPNLERVLMEVWREGASGVVSERNAMRYRNGKLSGDFTDVLHRCGFETSTVDENGKKVQLRTFHCLRHTFVSMAIEAGIPDAIIQRLVGHSTFEMTLRYYRSNLKVVREQIRKLPEMLVQRGGTTLRYLHKDIAKMPDFC